MIQCDCFSIGDNPHIMTLNDDEYVQYIFRADNYPKNRSQSSGNSGTLNPIPTVY